MNPADLLMEMKRTVEQLAAFHDIAKTLVSTLEVNEVLNGIGTRLSALLGAERWSLLLKGDDGRLHFGLTQGPGSEALMKETIALGEGIVGSVFASGTSRVVADVSVEPDFAPRFDELTSTRTGSVLVVPLKVRGSVLGVLELVSPVGHRVFTQEDLRAASSVADFAGIAIDNAQNFKRVQELTLIDEHTGLYNSRHLLEQLEHEVARCSRFARPVSLIFLDLDDFKSVNDTYGHLVGSAALHHTGKIITSAIRGVDSAYRFGGDEFAVLLVETGFDGSTTVAERILSAFKTMPYTFGDGSSVVLQASVGVATFPEDGLTSRTLLEAADQAMYRAKRSGKGMWRRLTSTPP